MLSSETASLSENARPSRSRAALIYGCYLVGMLLFGAALWPVLGRAFVPRSEELFRFAGLPDRYGMVVLFGADDCASHGPMITALNQAHEVDGIQVRGVLVGGADERSREDAIQDFDARFPLLQGVEPHARKTFSRLGYRQTPVVAVVDPEGRPVMFIPPSDLGWKEADGIRLATNLIKSQRP